MASPSSDRWQDVRLVGFATRVELELARARLDALLPEPTAQTVPLGDALGRILAVSATAPCDLPPLPRARIDGYATTAAATFGASAYNPLELPHALSPVTAGEPMPAGADAVLPFGAVTASGAMLEAMEPAAPGDGVDAKGAAWRRGLTVASTGRRLSPLDLARAAEAGLRQLEVWRRPEVCLLVPGAKPGGGAADVLDLLLSGLIARDGGSARRIPVTAGIAQALRALGPADLVLVAGRSGCGGDDDAAPALAAAGHVDVHGIAIAPGGSAGLGSIGELPVVLLPGEPLACLAAYELLAGHGVRRLAGLPAMSPSSAPARAPCGQDRLASRHDRVVARTARRRRRSATGAARPGRAGDLSRRDRLRAGTCRVGGSSGRLRGRRPPLRAWPWLTRTAPRPPCSRFSPERRASSSSSR